MLINENHSKDEEKSETEKLRESLFMSKKHSALQMSEEQINLADDFCEGYKVFLDVAKTEREAVACAMSMAQKSGFSEFDSNKNYKPGDKVYYVNRGKSIVLAIIGKKGVKDGAKITVAHIDSPRLDIKPIPLYEASDLALLKTHYYGGIKKISMDDYSTVFTWKNRQKRRFFC